MADVCWVIVLFFPLSLWRGEGWERGQSPSMVGSKLERYPLFGPFLLKEKEPSLCRDIHRLQSREPRHHWRMRNCARRSEEHTSELQSLMRISYAVFCLKKKTRCTDTIEVNVKQEAKKYTIRLHIKS